MRLRRDHEHDGVYDFAHGQRPEVVAQLPGLDAAEVQDVVDDAEQVFLAALDADEVLELLLSSRARRYPSRSDPCSRRWR